MTVNFRSPHQFIPILVILFITLGKSATAIQCIFFSYTSVKSPISVDSALEAKSAMSASDCMPEGLVYDAGLSGCETSFKLLWSLAAFNLLSAVLSLFFGNYQFAPYVLSC